MKTRREFLKLIGKSAAVLGLAASVPATAISKIIEKPGTDTVRWTVDEAKPEDYVLAPSWEPYVAPRICKDMDEFNKHFRVVIADLTKHINVYQIHYLDPVEIKCTPRQVFSAIREQLDGDLYMDAPVYAVTENIVEFANGWGWNSGWSHVYDSEDFMRYHLKEQYKPWRKSQDILFRAEDYGYIYMESSV